LSDDKKQKVFSGTKAKFSFTKVDPLGIEEVVEFEPFTVDSHVLEVQPMLLPTTGIFESSFEAELVGLDTRGTGLCRMPGEDDAQFRKRVMDAMAEVTERKAHAFTPKREGTHDWWDSDD
jgi:hypothetical protein